MEVDLGYSVEKRCLVEKVTKYDRLDQVRAELHDTLDWSLPPVTNLTDPNDLKFIEPMLIALASPERSERLHVACRFGLVHAVTAFLAIGDDSNALDRSGY